MWTWTLHGPYNFHDHRIADEIAELADKSRISC